MKNFCATLFLICAILNLTRENYCQEATLNASANSENTNSETQDPDLLFPSYISEIVFYADPRCEDGFEFIFGDCRPVSVDPEESEE